MTAHVVFTAFDPDLPATTSPTMIAQVIRALIGFDGALMSDDVSMGALSGSISARTTAALAAGCDLVLHCNGRLLEMQAVAAAAPELTGAAARRAAAAIAARQGAGEFDRAAARAEFGRMMTGRAPTQVTGS
jgi:beta-N-acetylhexosaminidase